MDIKELLTKHERTIYHGLEGCGKSSKCFEELKEIATVEEPILFAYKTYKLMQEQIDNWSKRFNISKDEFAIVGFNLQDNAPGLEYYTNKDYPNYVDKKVRFIFITQSSLQRGNYKNIKCDLDTPLKQYKKIKHIVVDEFDFTIGLIPTLDYVINGRLDNIANSKQEKIFYDWVVRNYTYDDYLEIRNIKKLNRKFTVAKWLKDESVKITFLTSEKLAVKILESIGFLCLSTGLLEMKDCVVNLYHSDLIKKEFYKVMNKNLLWNNLSNNYDLIISDNILNYYKPNNNELEYDNPLNIMILNHTLARGSNDYINNRILTILSYIPKEAIGQLKLCLNEFGTDIKDDTITGLFYRDRLCQAIGRSLGYRGGKETDVIIHSALYDHIRDVDFPYTIIANNFETSDKLDFCNKDDVFTQIRNEILKYRRLDNEYKKQNKRRTTELINHDYLSDYFQECYSDYITISDVKEYCKCYNLLSDTKQGYIPASKIANYFQKNITYMKIDGLTVRVIRNLKFVKYFEKGV